MSTKERSSKPRPRRPEPATADALELARRADPGMRRFGPRRRPAALFALVALLVVLLALDLWLEAGLVGGSPYVLAIVASAWVARPRVTLALAIATTLLITGVQVAIRPGDWSWAGWSGSLLAIGLVWLVASFVLVLLRAHRRFELALEATPTAVLLTDQPGEILLANRQAERLFGYPRGGLIGREVSALVPQRLRARFLATRRAYFERGVEAGEDVRELKARRHDGSEVPIEVSLHPLQTERGLVLYTAIRDLSNRRQLEREKDRLAALVQTSSDAIVVVDVEGLVTSWNGGAEMLYGRRAEEMIGLPLWMIAPSEREAETRRTVEQVASGERVRQLETEHVASDGRRLRVALSASPVRDARGGVDGVAIIARDVTEQKRAEALLLEMNLALSNAMPGHAYVDANGRVTMANESLREIVGPSGADWSRRQEEPWLERFAPSARESLESAFEAMLKEGNAETTARVDPDRERYADVLLVRRSGAGGTFQGHHLFARDVTPRVTAEKRLRELAQELERTNDDLERLAQVDPLTGLLNRRGLERMLGVEARRTQREGSNLVAILVDLDDFKAFNERYGHHGGDKVLAAVANRIRHISRATDGAARIGGDEFLLVLPATRMAEARLVAERLRTAVSSEVVPLRDASGAEVDVRVTCSIGLAEVPADNPSIGSLLIRTRSALQHSKSLGKDRVSGVARDGAAQANESLDELLLRILDTSDVRILQQPIVDLRENAVVAYELLARGPVGPLESPADLFSLAAANDVLARTDLVCLRKAVSGARLLPGGRRLHLNVYPQTLHGRGLDAVLTILEELPKDRRVCVELNEQAFIGDPMALREPVDRIRAAGHQIALDDVGFGKSALETLVLLEPEIVKLDRRVILGAAHDPARRRTLDRLLNVVHGLRALAIAEGIEDEDDRTFLLDLGLRYAQGFFLARPAPLDQVLRLDVTLKPQGPAARTASEGRQPSR